MKTRTEVEYRDLSMWQRLFNHVTGSPSSPDIGDQRKTLV